MEYDDLFKVLYNLKLHPELIEFIEIGEIEAKYAQDKYYRIIFHNAYPEHDAYINLYFSGVITRIDCTEEQYREARAYLEEISDKYKELCVNELMQSLEL